MGGAEEEGTMLVQAGVVIRRPRGRSPVVVEGFDRGVGGGGAGRDGGGGGGVEVGCGEGEGL